MEIIKTCSQGSQEWFDMRVGSIGGSSISSVVAGGKGKTRNTLLYRLAGEILSGQKYEGYSNDHMSRGVALEADARIFYELMTDSEVEQVTLIKHSDHIHYSADGLVGDDGLIEIKCQIPSVFIETILTEKIKGEYVKQMQWGLFVCERQWCDFVSYSPTVTAKPIWIRRVTRDEDMITDLYAGAGKFIGEMMRIVEKIRG